MKAGRTKRLTLDRVLKILQLRFGTQVQTVNKKDNLYFVDDIQKTFTRADILGIEDKIYSSLGC